MGRKRPFNKLSFLIECAIEFENEEAQRRAEEQSRSQEPPEQSDSKEEDEKEPVKPKSKSRRNKATGVPNSFKETSSVTSTDESIPRHQMELLMDVASSEDNSSKVSPLSPLVESTVDCSDAIIVQSMEPSCEGVSILPLTTKTISEFSSERCRRRADEQSLSDELPEQSYSKEDDEKEPVKPRRRRNKAARVPNSSSSVASTDESIPRHQQELSVGVASSEDNYSEVSPWDSWVESTVDCSDAILIQSMEPPYQGSPLITKTISEFSSERSRRNIIKSMQSIASDYSDNEKKSHPNIDTKQNSSQIAVVSGFKACVLCDGRFRPISCDYSKSSISIGGLKRRFCEYFDINTADFNPNLDTFLRRDKYPFCPECLALVNNLYQRAEQFRRAVCSYKAAKASVLNKAVNAAEQRSKVDDVDADPYYFVKLKVLQTNLLLEDDPAQSITGDEDIKQIISEELCLYQTSGEQEFLMEKPVDFAGGSESDATVKIQSPSQTAAMTSPCPKSIPKRKRPSCDSSEARRNFTSPPSTDGVNKSAEKKLLEKLDEASTDNVSPSSLSPPASKFRKSVKKVRSKEVHCRPELTFPRGNLYTIFITTYVYRILSTWVFVN